MCNRRTAFCLHLQGAIHFWLPWRERQQIFSSRHGVVCQKTWILKGKEWNMPCNIDTNCKRPYGCQHSWLRLMQTRSPIVVYTHTYKPEACVAHSLGRRYARLSAGGVNVRGKCNLSRCRTVSWFYLPRLPCWLSKLPCVLTLCCQYEYINSSENRPNI